jgi:Ice-binding-like
MNNGVPKKADARRGARSAASPPPKHWPVRKFRRLGILLVGVLCSLLYAGNALAANPSVGLGSAASFSVLAGSTVTNTGPTTMFGDLGLSPGSSVTGAPVVLGATHVDDAVAIGAKNALTTAYNDAASRASNGSAGTDLAGQTFTPGVRTASSSLLLSAGSVTLDAQGDPNAVFIFQIGSTLTTGSNTSVSLINGAQACNVFWQVGSSATLGTGTSFVGTIMAAETITANTAATIHGRLLASTAAVNLDTNTITTSNCASSVSGGGGGTEETTLAEKGLLPTPAAPAGPTAPTTPGGTGSPAIPTTTAVLAPIGSRTTITSKALAAKRRAAARKAAARRRRHRAAAAKRRHTQARTATPHARGGFTG